MNATIILKLAAARRRLTSLEEASGPFNDSAARYLESSEDLDTFHRLRRKIIESAGKELAHLERQQADERKVG